MGPACCRCQLTITPRAPESSSTILLFACPFQGVSDRDGDAIKAHSAIKQLKHAVPGVEIQARVAHRRPPPIQRIASREAAIMAALNRVEVMDKPHTRASHTCIVEAVAVYDRSRNGRSA